MSTRETTTKRPLAGFGGAVRSESLKTHPFGLIMRWMLPVVLCSVLGAAGLAVINQQARSEYHNPVDHVPLALVLIGLLLIGTVWAAVNAAWLHLREVQSGQLYETYRCTPRRGAVVAARGLLGGAVSAVTGIIAVSGAFAVFAALEGGKAAEQIRETLLSRWDISLVWGLCMGLLAVMAVSVAALVRSVPIGLGIIIGWFFIGEDLLQRIPGVGHLIGHLLPVQNAQFAAGLGDVGLAGTRPLALGLLVVETVLLLVAAIVVESRRDVRAG